MIRLLTNRRVLISAAVVGALLTVALWPTSVPVETATISRGPLVVTIDEEGRTRVRQRFLVSAPVSGRVMRIGLEAGDTVKRGSVVAQMRAEEAPLLDARSRAEAEAAVEAAKAALGRIQVDEQRARTALLQAERELKRANELVASGGITSQQVDAREDEAKAATESVSAAAYAVRVAASDLQRAVARLTPTVPDRTGRVVSVTAPVDGVVLRRLRESESIVPAGEALLEIGNLSDLEVVADLLSTDAVRVMIGARATIEQWGGSHPLGAKVRRVEPAGFTKISALGVEEQRVNVILDFDDPASAGAALGDAYRVEVRIVIWEAQDVLKAPTSALFREAGQWAVYVIDQGRARLTMVEIGHQTGQEAELTSGLSEGARVIVYPGDTVSDGVRVEER